MAVSRPSDARRRALNDDLTVPSVSNFFPIENYYDAADKVHASFQNAFQASMGSSSSGNSHLDDAFVYGKRYCSFVLLEIPKHNYHKSKKYTALAQKHTKQADRVLSQLEQVALKMDREEEIREKQRQLQAKKLAEQRAKEEERRFLELQKRAQKQLSSPVVAHTVTPPDDLEASALRKLHALRPPPPKQPEELPRDPSGEEPTTTTTSSTTRFRFHVEDSSDEDVDTGLPPPVLPPGTAASPPSYDQVAARHRHFLGPQAQEHKPLNGAAKQHPFTLSYAVPPPVEPKKPQRVSMKQLQQRYSQEYHRCVQQKQIEVSGLGTYQGRLYESTNGCTVISALVAARHLTSHGGITDPQIVQVIDKECGPLLREIRGKLGLGGSALIIPSDVHDHLVDRKILKQKHFAGAAGGNIMDPAHMGEFLKLIAKGEDGKAPWDQKAAATLFFREHVISIVKLPVGPNQVYYDLIDSLPGLNHGGRSMASRTRSTSVEALQVMLKWYTSRKFTDDNCHYIDRNPQWDDSMADFDPRVFQGFVWAAK